MFDPLGKCHSYYSLSSFTSANKALGIKNHKAVYVLESMEQNIISYFMMSQLSSPKRMKQ